MSMPYDAKLVFAKTAKGSEEISQRKHGLSPRQRRVLIVIDGIKSFGEVMEILPAVIPKQEMNEILAHLVNEGFIDNGQPPAAHAKEKPSAHVVELHAKRPAPTLTDDPATIRLVKDFMTTTCQTYLGLLAADVVQRIERAKTAEQLMAVVGYWHMALRDSGQGNRFAGPYLEQVKNALAYGAEQPGKELGELKQSY